MGSHVDDYEPQFRSGWKIACEVRGFQGEWSQTKGIFGAHQGVLKKLTK